MSNVASASLYNSGSDYAVSAFGLPRGFPSSVSFDTTGSFIVPENSSVGITASYDGTPVTSLARKYPRNLLVASTTTSAIFYVVPNFVVPPPTVTTPPPTVTTAPPPEPIPSIFYLSVNGDGGQNISATFGSEWYAAGTRVSVDMTPAPGYQFVQWSDDIQFLQQPKTIKSNTILMPSQHVVITPEVALIVAPTTTTTPMPTTTTTPAPTTTTTTPAPDECLCRLVTILTDPSPGFTYTIRYLNCTGNSEEITDVEVGVAETVNTLDLNSIIVTSNAMEPMTPDIAVVPCE